MPDFVPSAIYTVYVRKYNDETLYKKELYSHASSRQFMNSMVMNPAIYRMSCLRMVSDGDLFLPIYKPDPKAYDWSREKGFYWRERTISKVVEL